MLSVITEFGVVVVDFVMWLSSFLREEHAPGLVSLALVMVLVFTILLFSIKTMGRYRALSKVEGIVDRSPTNAVQFSASITQVNQEIKELAASNSSHQKQIVAKAWEEYRETFIEQSDGDRQIQHNSVRPSQFFNVEDLHFGAGFFRVWPGLFVTLGLFLTFLGLISALDAMNTAEGVSEEAMSNLLAVASAKFIMSLTGLLCSIAFTIVLRFGTGQIERVLHSLNGALEKRLEFLSLERLAVKQNQLTEEQRDHFRQIGLELVEELGRPLREELPKAISKSIGDAMSPLIEQVGELGTNSVGDMVKDLSNQLSTDVDGALSGASRQLEIASDKLVDLVDRMAGNSDRMSTEMIGASESLLEVVQTFRTITDESASNQRERMAKSGNAVVQVIDEAGEKVLGTINDTGRQIVGIAGEVTERAGKNLIEPMEQITQQMLAMVAALKQSVDEIQRVSDGVKDGANAASDASTNFRGAAQVLVGASNGIRPTVEQIQSSMRDLSSTVRRIGESVNSNAANVKQVLDAATITLGGERHAMEASLKGLENVLAKAKGQGDQLDDIDEKLGRAFEKYRTQVSDAVESLHDHVAKMRDNLRPAVDTLADVVAQAQDFIPESRGRRPYPR